MKRYPRRIKVVPVFTTDITLEMWQRTPELVSEALRVSKDPAFKMMLDCMKASSPVHNGFPEMGTQLMDRAAHQAKTEGYHLALNNLEAMVTLAKVHERIEATFEDPDNQNKE